ncbi:hypothetical protein GGR52DRAFT_590498 [Hypoxylon sp. FL1284]|nr:hypothetical protein GGR52DRAFT_590498 [Hypoxylon sp. FL1284]
MTPKRRSATAVPAHMKELLRSIHGSGKYLDTCEHESQHREEVPARLISKSVSDINISGYANSLPVPPLEDKEIWADGIAKGIVTAVSQYNKRGMLLSSSMRALWSMISRGISPSTLICEPETPWTLKNGLTGGFSSRMTSLIVKHKPRFILLASHCDISRPGVVEEPYAAPHFFSVLIDCPNQRVYTFDTLNDSGAGKRADLALSNLINAFNKSRKLPILDSAVLHRVNVVSQSDRWTCGYWSALIPYLLFKKPLSFLRTIQDSKLDQKATLDSYIRIVSSYAGIGDWSRRSSPSKDEEKGTAIQAPVEDPAEVPGSQFTAINATGSLSGSLSLIPGAAYRPQPVTPHGQPGWAGYAKQVKKIDGRPAKRPKRTRKERDELAIKRGKEADDLVKLDERGHQVLQ